MVDMEPEPGAESFLQFSAATEEWDNVAEIEATFGGRQQGHGTSHTNQPPLAAPLTTVQTVLHYLEQPWMDNYIAQVSLEGEGRRGVTKRILACLPWTVDPLSELLKQEVRRVMATALVPLDNDCPIQLGMLRTIYRQLTGSRVDPPRYGGHWEDIGFQGTDPGTDLRGVGILGLVHALYLCMSTEVLPLGQAIHSLSRDPRQEFPMLVLSINVSRICLHALRDGLLDRLISEEDSVWSAANSFYAAVLFHVYQRWKTEHLTITSSGFVLQEAESTGRKNPGLLVRRLEKALATDFSVESNQVARDQVLRDSSKHS